MCRKEPSLNALSATGVSKESTEPPAGPLAQHFAWWGAWKLAIARPSVLTYQRLAADPEATARRAYLWVAEAILVTLVAVVLMVWLIPALRLNWLAERDMLLREMPAAVWRLWRTAPRSVELLLALLIGIVSVPLAVLALTIQAGVPHLVARALGGVGSFDDMVYVFAAFLLPTQVLGFAAYALLAWGLLAMQAASTLWLVSNLCMLILAAVIALYPLVLGIVATRAVHGLDTSKAVVAMLPGFALLLLNCSCGVLSGVPGE
jgi:hypothetical protein